MRKPKSTLPTIVGLDLSLRRPAACILLPQWDPGEPTKHCMVQAFPQQPVEGIDPGASVERINCIMNDVFAFMDKHRPSGEFQVFVEDYAYGMAAGSSRALQLAELGGSMKLMLWMSYLVVAKPINSMTARKAFLGKLPKGKGAAQKAVQDAAIALGIVAKGSGSDEADAFVVANAGRAELGFPFACIG